jgi:CubicO group peptidase (beta-lactamase class C family)
MKSIYAIIGMVLCFSFLSFSQSQSDNTSDYLAQNKQMDALVAKWQIKNGPGLVIAVIKDEKVIYKKSSGLANLEYKLPITNTSVFNMTSVAQQFTAFAILLLEKQGKLKLDDDIRKYVPEAPNFGKTITLRHLANHASGLRDYLYLKEMQGWLHRDVIAMKDVLQVVAKQNKLNFEPGEEYSYSRTNYTLLATVVERISKIPFSEFCKKHIFSPLQMNNTTVLDNSFTIIKNRTTTYFLNSKGFNKIAVNNEVVGDGNIFTTIDDLILWTLNFSNPKVGDSTIINKMNTPFVLNGGNTTCGGFGQEIGKYKGVPEISQHGLQGGYKAKVTRFPSENFTIIVLSNSAETNTYKPIQEVVDIYLIDKLSPSPLMEPNNIETRDTSENKQFTKDQICGIYRHNSGKLGYEINIYQKDDILSVSMDFINCHFQIGNNIGNKYEILENKPVKFVFTDLKNDQAQLLTKYETGHASAWKRVENEDLSKSNLNDYIGEFYSEELSTTYMFEVIDGTLTLKHNKLNPFTFKQTGLSRFQGSVSLFNQVEFVRDYNGEITGAEISNLGARNVYFGKKTVARSSGVQEKYSCKTHVSINSKDGWWLNIENPVTNEEIVIDQDSGTFKIYIQECVGLLELSRYKNDKLIESGMLKINSKVIADTIFLADKKGKVYPHPYPRRYAHKVGIWKYYNHDGTIIKEEEY